MNGSETNFRSSSMLQKKLTASEIRIFAEFYDILFVNFQISRSTNLTENKLRRSLETPRPIDAGDLAENVLLKRFGFTHSKIEMGFHNPKRR